MTNHNGHLPRFKYFSYDCDHHVKKDYSIVHDPRPLPLSEAITRALEYLLWYVPNINSFQSPSNVLITEPLYEDFSFGLVTEALRLNAEDILFLDYIDDDIVDYYMEAICTNCQKVILTTGEHETKISALVRHMRNAIAHGYFTVVDDRMIAFDVKYFPKKDDSYGCTAVLKLDPLHLVSALKLLEEEMTHERLAAIAFSRCGYEILENDYDNPELPYDFTMEKDGLVYAVEIKRIAIEGVAHAEHLDSILAHFPKEVKEKKVLLMDSAVLDSEAKRALRQNKILLLDRDNLKSLMSGDDILNRIQRKMR